MSKRQSWLPRMCSLHYQCPPLLSDQAELKHAMMRPRLEKFALKKKDEGQNEEEEQQTDLFYRKKERWNKSESEALWDVWDRGLVDATNLRLQELDMTWRMDFQVNRRGGL